MSDNNSSKFFLKQYVLLKRCQWWKREEERNKKKVEMKFNFSLTQKKLSRKILQDNNCSESEDAWGNLLNKKENEMFMQRKRKKQQKQVQHKLFSVRSLCYGCISSHFSLPLSTLCHDLRREIFSISRTREEAFWVATNGNGRHSRRN